MKLLHHHYGKARVRVMKVARGGERHSLKELDISVMLQGGFDASYTKADNRLVVPTDTMKNTVNVLAKEELGSETEAFGLVVARHFLKTYPQVETVQVRLAERCWERIAVQGLPHAHSFTEKSPAKPFAEVTCSRKDTTIQSGINDLLILKTTQSGFEGYDVRDKFTTLSETRTESSPPNCARPGYMPGNRRVVPKPTRGFWRRCWRSSLPPTVLRCKRRFSRWAKPR